MSTAIDNPAGVNRLRTGTASVSPGSITVTPAVAMIAEVMPSSRANSQNSQNGCGSLLPTFSTTLSARMIHGNRSV